MLEMSKTDRLCDTCMHRRNVSGSAHSRCNNFEANVLGNIFGIKKGWFNWPYDFDPTWLESCDGFSDKLEDKQAAERKGPALAEILALLR